MTAPKGTVLLMGGSGFLGKLIGNHLTAQGYEINCVALEAPDYFISLGYPCQYFSWDGESPIPDEALQGKQQKVSIIINLAGDPLSTDRWGARKRRAILESRIRATEIAVDAADRCQAATMIQASSVDYYGDRGGETATEATGVGRGFWPETIARWERATSTLSTQTRLVTLRMGEVFSIYGGSFRQRLEPYCHHVGAPLAHGKHFLNWIHGDDLACLVQAIIENPAWEGAVNATAPEPCSQRELHQHFSSYYKSFIRIPIPLWVKRIAFGKEMDKAAINVKARPQKIEGMAFSYQFSNIQACMKELLDRTAPDCCYYTQSVWLPAPPEKVWDFFATAKNWERINPPVFQLKVNEDSIKYAEEGKRFKYRLYFFRTFPAAWSIRYTHLKRGVLFKALVQDGFMNMLELSQKYTPVAGGTRLDDMMRYQMPQSYYVIPFVRRIVNYCNRITFSYRHRALLKTFAQEKSSIKKAS